MLTVPEPLPNDPEAVITALETAEIFGKQGDLKEAVRWVRRAAEIAGDEGSDERALTLARAVADLNISASQPPEPPPPLPGASASVEAAPPPPPPPPPLTAGSTAYDVPPADADEDAETRVVNSAKMLEELDKQHSAPHPTNGSNGTAAASAAAAAAVPAPAPEPAAEAAPPPPTPPAEEASPPEPAEETAPGSRRVSSMAELLAQKEAEATSAALAAAEADEAWHDAPDPVPSTPPEAMERRTARPDGARITTPLIPSKPYTERPPVEAPVLQAVRASIVATAEPGVFVMRVLTAGQSIGPTAQEVLVVATDPNASPFGQKWGK